MPCSVLRYSHFCDCCRHHPIMVSPPRRTQDVHQGGRWQQREHSEGFYAGNAPILGNFLTIPDLGNDHRRANPEVIHHHLLSDLGYRSNWEWGQIERGD